MPLPHFAFALCTAAGATLLAQVSPEQFAGIKKEGLEHSQVMAHLDHLTNRIGPRLTSSDNLTVADEWARDTFQSFGIDNAHLEQWGTFPVGFNRGPWWGRMTKPEPMELVCNTEAWSAGTRRPSRGPLLQAPRDAEGLAALEGKLAGVWILDPPRGDLLNQLSAAMEKEGAFGFLAGGGGDLLLTGGRSNVDWDNLPKLPMVRLTKDGYTALHEQLDAGKPVEVEFDIRNHFRKGPIPLFNVIADIPGTEHPDEFVVVGGHLDSWDGAVGATDNGTGTATTIEAARILMAIGAKPKRTIRFMLWSGEEQGLLGSRAWVQKHKDELDKYSACLVHDGGTNYLSGIAGMAEMHAQLETVFAPIFDLSPDMPFEIRDIAAFTPIGSDHESFTAAGVPGFFWKQSGRANYTHTHHTQYDTYDAAIEEYQRHSSVVIATGALGIANLPELLTRENMKVQRGFGGGGGRRGGGGRLLGVQLEDDGITLADVTPDGLAVKAGMKAGDRILKIGDKAIKSVEDLRAAMTAAPVKTSVTWKRGDKEMSAEITFAR
ncbi:MAG TPA: M20/M25/M40 family metallo-hydrolase [Planctomycetota bacterium]|nr:M20/M25/M40 family metallo-hydrolase [Planctomycetota bacterium]